MKRLLVGVAVGLLVIGLVIAGVAWHDSRRAAEAKRAWLVHLRDEARQLVGYCDLEGFGARLAMGTSKFGYYIAADRAQGKRVLADIVEPVISAQELACGSAKTDLELYRRDGEPDRWIDAQMPKIEAAVATLARVRAAFDALRRGFDADAPGEQLMTALAALHEAARP